MPYGDGKYKLLGTENSYFTSKARAYLRAKKIPFVEVEATPAVRQTIIGPRTGVQFIPVLICPDDTTVIQDTSDIIDYLERTHPEPRLLPDPEQQPLKAWANYLLEAWSDEWLVIWAMHYRWSRRDERSHIYFEFGRMALMGAFPGPGQVQKYLDIGSKMGDQFSAASLFGQGISSLGDKACEAHFERCILEPLAKHFTGSPYLLGNVPSLGDFSLMGPFYAHLYRDPWPSTMIKMKAQPVADWIERASGMVPARSEPGRIIGADPATSKSGQKLKFQYAPIPKEDDRIAESILFLFRLIFADFLPHILDVVRIVRESVAAMPESDRRKPLKRTIGGVDFRLTNPEDPKKPFKGNRRVYPYALFMIKRVVDCFDQLSATGRGTVEEFIASLGDGAPATWQAVRNAVASIRVKRQDNQIVVDWERMGSAKL
ncbi:hypothetical protein DFJ74DRAFT_186083 [Hyaloraphidium curvatum]|nr:hypothetical protein DFJ74DRAFT_186083 [Hyaloraphidium curvatum]